jgi:hypothetical protein
MCFACYAWTVGASEDLSAAERESRTRQAGKSLKKANFGFQNPENCNMRPEYANEVFECQLSIEIPELTALRGHQKRAEKWSFLLTGNQPGGATKRGT